MVVGSALAQRILEDANYDGQRPLGQPHVAFLANHMRRNTFRRGTQLGFALIDGHLVLTNGQHRLNAIVQSGAEVEFQVLIEPAKNAQELAAIYYSHDRGARHRSDAEVLAAVGVADRFGLSRSAARSIFQAQPLISNRFVRPSYLDDPSIRNDDIRLEACKNWWAIGAKYEALLEGAPGAVRKRLLQSQAVAVALVILKYQEAVATDFWRGVAGDDGLRRDDPRKALLIDLPTREWARKSSDGCVAVATAWNAFFERRPLKMVKVGVGATVRIVGTPYDGRRA